MCGCILCYFDIDIYVLRAGVSVNAGSGGEEMEEIQYVWCSGERLQTMLGVLISGYYSGVLYRVSGQDLREWGPEYE